MSFLRNVTTEQSLDGNAGRQILGSTHSFNVTNLRPWKHCLVPSSLDMHKYPTITTWPPDLLVTDSIRPPERRAWLHVPDSYYEARVPRPLMVALHGKDQPTKELEYHTQLPNAAFNLYAILGYPECVDLQWTGDPEAPPRDEVDDVGFIDVLIDHIMRDYAVDAVRVYIAGFNTGAGLAGLLACDPERPAASQASLCLRAAVYQDVALKEPLFSICHHSRRPAPILEFHRDADP
ncbi:uncharacterized protein Z519_03733 [Cladophialophora bantiana CBS 173.52]|uniref:feruloyl esterase n=1 Tax=Cladophialophora bantiana (strain ATCC 10958 / CBS 173.52 / CDC B-1940 / NIH 8579) TaxID=1442370 RepID=A0A0D2IED7_CLAB1|nr:uncharacterized protein Z519_03733 [Cladophialophora bantiana CBS 173.52]KIW95149.1 hypothetical protein Z519_03733 [Cladophialophora bantiana CBS 173.52]